MPSKPISLLLLFCLVNQSVAVAQNQLQPVATDIEVHPNKRIAAGDDIVVFGTGGFSGVDYMVPSSRENRARGIPNGNRFHASSFAVAGKKIALVNNFQVTIFDTVSGRSFEFPLDELRLTTVPGPLHAPGHMHCDGNLVICRSDKSTADQRLIKVIDVNPAEPRLISLAVSPPVIRAEFINHVLVDANTNRAIAATQDSFFVYDLNHPNADPVEIEMADGISDVPPKLDGHRVLFQNREAHPKTKLLNLETRKTITLAHNPSAGVIELCNGSLGYFVSANSQDSAGNGIRTVIGDVGHLDDVTVAERHLINGRTANHGAIGFGETLAISPSGKTWFLGGLAAVGAGEYLQISHGGKFRLLPDPRGVDRFGCYATDVSICNKTVAFKTKGIDHRMAYVGYLVFNE